MNTANKSEIDTEKVVELIQEELSKRKNPGFLDILAFGVSASVMYFFITAILLLWFSLTEFAADYIRLFESLHPMGSMSVLSGDVSQRSFGYFVNLIYSLLDGFILGVGLAFFNNQFLTLFSKRKKTSDMDQ